MDYICKFCNKEFKKGQSLGAHIISCRLNPKMKEISKKRAKTLSYNKNLKIPKYYYYDICKECGSEFGGVFRFKHHLGKFCSPKCGHNSRKQSKETKRKISETLKRVHPKKIKLKLPIINGRRFVSEETRKKLSLALKGKSGGYRVKSGTSKFHGSYYNDIWMDSSWEVKCAKILDKNNFVWKRDSKYKFYYHDLDGNKKKYYPDFYLPDFDIFIEVKGYWTKEVFHKIKNVLDNNFINLLILDSLEKIENLLDYLNKFDRYNNAELLQNVFNRNKKFIRSKK